jgi:hypothetical protein
MKLTSTNQLLELDKLYGYCHKTGQYEEAKEIIEVVFISKFKRRGIKGVDNDGRKLYTQVNYELFDKLYNKFDILKKIK